MADRALVVRVKNVGDAVKSQGGATGALAFSITPETISNVVYSKIRDELISGFRDKGIDVDVQLTSTPPTGPAPKNEFLRGAALGAGTIAALLLLKGLFSKR